MERGDPHESIERPDGEHQADPTAWGPNEAPPPISATTAEDRYVAAAIDALSAPGQLLAAATVKGAPGLYAIHGDVQTWIDLGLGEPPDSRPLYVGKAEDSLIKRDLRTHFGAGQTGRSTVRRSIAALLRDTLSLRGVPRNPAKPERPANFGMSDEHERRLGEWMQTHLLLATWPKPDACTSLVAVEVRLIAHWQPPLNLKDNRSPWKQRLSDERRVMANDARDWAQQRGHRI